MKVNKIARWSRWIMLGLLLAWVTYETIMHQVLGGGKSPSIHALCPYGAIESLYAILISGSMLQKIYTGTFLLLGVTVLIAVLFRRSFCGVLCPFGALQELFARIGLKLWKKRPTIPLKADRILRYLKYVVLVVTAVMAWQLGRLWFTSFDPYAAYGHITAIPETLAEDPLSIIGFVLLGVTVVGSFVYDRFFCKFLCPAGALYAIIGKISPTKVVRDESVCINCNLCSKACPMNIDVAKMEQVNSAECINCNECVAVCPKAGALDVKIARKKVSLLVVLALVIGLFFVPIIVAQVTGNFQILAESKAAGQNISFTEIKGFMTIAEAVQATGFSEKLFRSAMKIPESIPADTAMNELSALIPGYDFDAAKEDAAAIYAPVTTDLSLETSNSAEKIDLSGVRGSRTIAEAAIAVGLSEKDFYVLFEIPEYVSPATRMKDIANIVPGYDFDAIKTSLK